MDGMDKLVDTLNMDFTGLSFLNLVDFDALFGHRRDPQGYGEALQEYDARLPVFAKLKEDDLLLITADHGNDPIHPGTDHTREYVPLLAYSPSMKEGGQELPLRQTFADIGATVAENFGVKCRIRNKLLKRAKEIGDKQMNRALITKSASYLKEKFQETPQVGLILGSGLGVLADEIENAVTVTVKSLNSQYQL